MLVILDVISGPVAGRRIEVRAGTVLRIGRTTKSDYTIGGDFYLSGQHFSVECDGAECRVRDLGSSNGTFVNGARVMDSVIIKNGDSLAAGGSMFTVRVEARELAPAIAMPPPLPISAGGSEPAAVRLERAADLTIADSSLRWPGFTRSQSVLLNTLFRDGESVFAILDAARDSRIPAFLDASGEQYALIDDSSSSSLYVASVPPQARLLDVLVKDGWGHGWGFYASARVNLEMACGHLRSFLTLRNQEGRTLTFRFWDPRVLRAMVPSMTPREALDFFGPLSRIIAEGERPEMAVEFSITAQGARQHPMVLV